MCKQKWSIACNDHYGSEEEKKINLQIKLHIDIKILPEYFTLEYITYIH